MTAFPTASSSATGFLRQPSQLSATVCCSCAWSLEWTYIAATEQLQNPKGVDNDIFDTVSEFAFVPFPRDPQADAYYQGYDTFGYLVPKGAKNMDGALEFINLNRAYDVDPVIRHR